VIRLERLTVCGLFLLALDKLIKMKSGQLYLIKTETLRITNLFQHGLLLSVKSYGSCTPKLHDGYISLEYGKFVTDAVNDPNEFRYLNWDSKIPYLSSILDSGENLIFGNYNLEVLKSIKKSLNGTIISYNYDHSLYSVMLEIFTRTHLYMQDHSIVPETEYDKNIKASGVDLVSHYMQVFDEQNLVPKCIPPVGDYSVPIQDYFNFEKFLNHFNNIGVCPSDSAKSYYGRWYQSWEPIWRKYNEG
jgi:hypothetical protein